VSGVTYDTGALLAAERGRRDMWRSHALLLRRGIEPTIPAGVLAQAWRGGSQPLLARFLNGCRIEPLDEPKSRAAGAACARSATADVVDASVVVSALARNDIVVTSDADDLEHIAHALGRRLDIRRV